MQIQMQMQTSVRLGERVYDSFSWKRKDKIYLQGQQIGIITLSEHDRTGTTVSFASGATRLGRQISWCGQDFTNFQRNDQRELMCA